MIRQLATAAVMLFAGAAIGQETQPQQCRLAFEPEPGSGRFVASVPVDVCRARLMERDHAQLAPAHELGRAFTGSVDLSSSTLDAEAAGRGERVHRWHITLPDPLGVAPSVSTLFTRIVSTEGRGPARIEKCNLENDGFDLFVVEHPGAELLELQVEWIAYEYTPPATPPTCRRP